MMSLHINNHYPKKRGFAKNVLFAVRAVLCHEQVDMVAGDFYGAAWRKKSGDNQQRDSTTEKAFANTSLPIPHGSSPLWGPGNVPGERADVCGFTEPPNTDNEWQVRGHGTLEINCDVLGTRPTDQSCHHEVWIHRFTRQRSAGRPIPFSQRCPQQARPAAGQEKRQSTRPHVTIHFAPERGSSI